MNIQKRTDYNIVLIGYRGTGKSTIGKALAHRLQAGFVSTDTMITDEEGLSISDIVQRYGWERFRTIEANIIHKVSHLKQTIIDCGGGVVENDENIGWLKKKGIIILFEADLETIVKRIEGDPSRPPLKNGSSLEEEVLSMLEQRKKLYEKAADHSVNTSTVPIEEVVDHIVHFLNGRAV